VTVFDRDNLYRYFEVEGVDELARKYYGEDFTGDRDRVIVKVKPRRIFSYQV
jgi:hypothetical protein